MLKVDQEKGIEKLQEGDERGGRRGLVERAGMRWEGKKTHYR